VREKDLTKYRQMRDTKQRHTIQNKPDGAVNNNSKELETELSSEHA
jgi:hypothetical protein